MAADGELERAVVLPFMLEELLFPILFLGSHWQVLVLTILLAHKSSVLDARAVDLALGLGTETLVGENVRLLGTWCCCWDAERKRER